MHPTSHIIFIDIPTVTQLVRDIAVCLREFKLGEKRKKIYHYKI